MMGNDVKVIGWPARSPDLNIVEDIWKMLSEMVYDEPQFVIDINQFFKLAF